MNDLSGVQNHLQEKIIIVLMEREIIDWHYLSRLNDVRL